MWRTTLTPGRRGVRGLWQEVECSCSLLGVVGRVILGFDLKMLQDTKAAPVLCNDHLC
jgi:hypothetical protein